MKKSLVSILVLFSLSCSDPGLSPQERDFNIRMSYGVRGLNELNTFQDVYTKDLILDGTVTIPMVLSDNEFHQIETKMLEIGFFGYPDTLTPIPQKTGVVSTPEAIIFFEVNDRGRTKYLLWECGDTSDRSEAVQLSELVALILRIIEAKPEYRNAPPVHGGYL